MSDTPIPDAKRAVFVSYAREDTAPAQRIAEALRSHGVEVWFDQNELRGGDTWDPKIRRQIRECVLFVPVVSAHTQDRSEGYFRLEWKLAVERTHLMLEGVPFLAPVVIDDTSESGAAVPSEFMKVQWTRLPGALPTPQFVEQIKRLLEAPRRGSATKAFASAAPQSSVAPAATKSMLPIGIAAALGAVVLGLIAFITLRPAATKENPAVTAPAPATPVAATKPPPAALAPAVVADKSIAVLPFVDMSQAKDQEYFSDGLSEELLNLLAKIPALSVTSRSSAFSYKGKDVKLAQVARELGVAHILEGSVRKSGNRLRITAQLIDARTDKHIWSETYDRSLDDIFAVQDDIAGAVVSQLKVTLLGAAPKAKAVDPKAYALSLQARQLRRQGTRESVAQALSLYSEALAIDPKFAAAWEGITLCRLRQYIMVWGTADKIQQLAREAANQTLALDPDSATAYSTLGSLILRSPGGDLATAARYNEHALVLDPANAETLNDSLVLFPILGRTEEVVAFGEYCVAHDPVGSLAHFILGRAYRWMGRRDEAISSFRTALRLSPDIALHHNAIGGELLLKQDAKAALAEFLQGPVDEDRPVNLAMAYYALGQKTQSDTALAEAISKYEKTAAWNIAYALAFRGEFDRAFEWLDKAIAYQDTGLTLSAVDPRFENLHSDPRWLPFLRKIGRAPEQVAGIKFNPRLPGK